MKRLNDEVKAELELIKNVDYGIKGYKVNKDFEESSMKYWKLLSPQELLESNTGICFDTAHYVSYVLDKYNLEHYSVFASGDNTMTHSFVVGVLDSDYYNNVYYIPEYSVWNMKGIHYYIGKSLDSVIRNYIIQCNNDYPKQKPMTEWNIFIDRPELEGLNSYDYQITIYDEKNTNQVYGVKN